MYTEGQIKVMKMDKRTRLESFSAREDDLREPDELYGIDQTSRHQPRQRNLALQIALGIWLGGTALMITWFILSLLFANLATNVLNGSLTPKFGSTSPASFQPESAARPQLAQLVEMHLTSSTGEAGAV
ncbi:hypothetical protein [Pseudomonas cavernicola]|uniref:hypothetical protein n=1 Tax=Pseudomonas cavernicola TaxID=2320866 RepID=UPI0015A873A5|nr:hypothetical protein [Pseudomonas cavernicola]